MHAITRLTLENFRNYAALELVVSPRPVIITGPNGAGKTNILEAVSLLAPGRGFRGAQLRQMDALSGGGKPWVVGAQIDSHGEEIWVGTGRDAEAAMDKRIVKINGVKQAQQSALSEVLGLQWLTPQMDSVFLEGNSARRKLLDRLVSLFDGSHPARITHYERAVRERMALLTGYSTPDTAWLNILEQEMAGLSVAISLARQEAMGHISQAMHAMPSDFPHAYWSLSGQVEEALAKTSHALDAEAQLAGALCAARALDKAAGRSSVGAHKSTLSVVHAGKGMPAETCSTGEQKACLLSIVIAAGLARNAFKGSPPVLLLDEVIAHLDVDKRKSLFELLLGAGIQAWLTGTDASDFSGFTAHVTHLQLAAGTLVVQG